MNSKIAKIAVFICFVTINIHLNAQENKVVIPIEEPTELDPVSVGAALVSSSKNVKKVIIKARILEGYHIYAYVPPSDPYIKSKVGIDVPNGAKLVDDMETPIPNVYPGKSNLLIYKNEIEFKQNITVNNSIEDNATITCWLYYQCCNANLCLPPIKKEIVLKLKK